MSGEFLSDKDAVSKKQKEEQDDAGNYPEPIHTFEHTYSIGKKYASHVFIQDDRSEVNRLRWRISNVRFHYGEGKAETMKNMLYEALKAREEKIQSGDVKRCPQPGTPEYRRWMTIQELVRYDEEEHDVALLREVYKRRRPIDFEAWCQNAGYDPKLVERVKETARFYTKSKGDKEWLRETLDGQKEMSTAEIRTLAESDGVISDRELDIIQANRDWDRLSKVARRDLRLHRNTTRSGYWKWS